MLSGFIAVSKLNMNHFGIFSLLKPFLNELITISMVKSLLMNNFFFFVWFLV